MLIRCVSINFEWNFDKFKEIIKAGIMEEAKAMQIIEQEGIEIETRLISADVGGRKIDLITVKKPDDLYDRVSEREFDQDERLPFWSELWPSSYALCSYLSETDIRGQKVLEIGAGMGLCGIYAALCGADVRVSDYDREALKFIRANQRINGVEINAALLDWRRDSADERFDLIIGADIWYEERNFEPVLKFLQKTLKPGGNAVITEPGRLMAREFLGSLRSHELFKTTETINHERKEINLIHFHNR